MLMIRISACTRPGPFLRGIFSPSATSIINKIDLAPYVGASLDVMESDTKVVRGNRPYILTNCKTGQGIEELVDMIEHMFLFAQKPAVKSGVSA